jgi:hypothetical protein
MTGIFAGATMPLTLELLAESSYPVSEGVTGNTAAFVMQFPATALVAIVGGSPPVVRADLVNLLMGVCFLCCLLLVIPVKESNKRRAAAEAAAPASVIDYDEDDQKF